MPIVSIDIRNSFTKEEEVALMRSVYSALKEVFQLSDDAINIRLFVHEPHRFAIPPTKNKSNTYMHPELYTVISIDCFEGRTIDTKRSLYLSPLKRLVFMRLDFFARRSLKSKS